MVGRSEVGYIDFRITKLSKHMYADLHIYHSASRLSSQRQVPSSQVTDSKLNKETLGFKSLPISSRHAANFDKIKTWQRECVDNHEKCREFPGMVAPTSMLPSRLLDVSGDKVRLECGVADLPAGLEFTTLSHMWGPDPSACPQLEVATLGKFAGDIPIGSLPGKYVYAIEITRALGYRYIWIDSLCIIQDSREDWQREAVKMAAVYGRSSCNISYTFPPAGDTAENFLRDPRVHLPCQAPLPEKKRSGSDSPTDNTLVIQYRPGYQRPSWSPTVYKRIWPLLSRGWVFQERLLCSRTVYFGQDRLMWECCTGITDEFYGPLTTVPGSKSHFHRVITGIASSLRTNDTAKPTNTASSSETSPKHHGNPNLDSDADATTADAQWGPLVRDYRAGDLTKEADRGIAFAGIVRAIAAHTGATYLAGLWRELFAYDLLWTVSPVAPAKDDSAQISVAYDPTMKPAPSWSWFSVRCARTLSGSDVLDFPFRTSMQTYRQFGLFEAPVVTYSHPLGDREDELLHNFADMKVVLRTKRVPCTLEWWEEFGMLCVLPHSDMRWVYGHQKNRIGDQWVSPRVLKYAHDDALVGREVSLPQNAQMILAVEQAWMVDPMDALLRRRAYNAENSETWKTSHQYAGLVVIPAGNGEWRRIGAFMYFDGFTGQLESPFDGAGEDLTLV